ncbi:hypothetical protein [Candidatus Avelusimicrobium facis]|uniref:hypothetical protein n=1 Tax=Candidatus Avelusimicrobium facis TaxID=3416203 RepID=UPI0015B7477C
MRGLIFTVLTLVLGGVIALGLEWLAALLPADMAQALNHIYHIGIHPLALNITICGALGLVSGYLIISKFVRK